MKTKNIIIKIVVLVVIIGLSFYIGMKVGQGGSKAGQGLGGVNGAGGFNSARMGRGGAQGAGAGFVTGEVLSKDATSVTVKLRDGGSKIIFVTGATAVQKTINGTLDDVVIGSQITANGQANSDGSINAVSIQQRPNMPVQGSATSTVAR